MSRGTEVSVVMPIAPRAEWLDRCLQSLRDQTYTKWNLVAVLDGECAHNLETLERSGLGSRLSVVQMSGGSGVAQALNAGMHHTQAPLVARMDADDVCMPSRLSVQVEAIGERPAVWAMGSAAVTIDSFGRAVGFRHVPSGPERVHKTLLWKNPLIHPSVIMRREKVLELGGYNPASERMQDYELWLRVGTHGQLDNVPEALLQYRLHDAQHSRGRRLQNLGEIRRARRSATNGRLGKVSADLRHAVWLGAQVLRDGKK